MSQQHAYCALKKCFKMGFASPLVYLPTLTLQGDY